MPITFSIAEHEYSVPQILHSTIVVWLDTLAIATIRSKREESIDFVAGVLALRESVSPYQIL